MKILLVEPRTPETFWSLRHALRFVGKRAANPPLGLADAGRPAAARLGPAPGRPEHP